MGSNERGTNSRRGVYLRSSLIALNSPVIGCAVIGCAVLGCSGGESLEEDSNLGRVEQALEIPIRAVRDGFYNVDQGQTLVVGAAEGLLANDSGASPLRASAGAVSRRGNPIEVQPDGSFTFTPGPDFFGEDRIDYVLTDGSGAQKASGARIVVRPINATENSVTTGSAGFAVSADAGAGGPEALGDVNGDGFGDFALMDWQLYPESGDRSLFQVVFGKADRSPVNTDDSSPGKGFTIDQEGFAGTGWTGTLIGVGDVNGDGLNDIGVSSATYYDYYDAGIGCFVVFGKNDSATVTLEDVADGVGGIPIETDGFTRGCQIVGPGDVNGDGLDDVLVERKTYFHEDADGVYVVFGKTGSGRVDLSDIETGVGGYPLFINDVYMKIVDTAGDMNQDGLADFLIGFGPDAAPNVAAVVFGKTDTMPGTLAAVVQGGGGFFIQGRPESDWTYTVSSGGDVNGDGVPDVTLRSRGPAAGYVVFGKTDAAPIDLELVSSGVGGFLVDSGDDSFEGPFIVDDLNADGRDDLLATRVSDDFVGVPNMGVVYAAYGRSASSPLVLDDLEAGSGGFVLHHPVQVSWMSVPAGRAGDVNADGFGDFLFEAVDDGTDVDTWGMLLGADFTGAVTNMGSPEVDTLVARGGAAVGDVLVGERGDDRLTSDGGPDVLLAGGGADRLTIVDANFSRIDAGTGSDVLKLGSTGMALALDAIPSSRLRSIETIDAVGAGANAIRVDVLRAVPLPVGTNTLTLRADASDTVTVVRGSASVSSGGGFVTYTRGRFRLRISKVAHIVEE